jgi:hypothetical protein
MRHALNTTAAFIICQLIAAAAILYGSLSILASIYERNLAAGLLALIPTVAGVALFTVVAVDELEDTQGGEEA